MKNKKFLGKKILSIALTILMVLSCVPLSTLTALAAEIEAVPVGASSGITTPPTVTAENYAALGLQEEDYEQFLGYFAIRNYSELSSFSSMVRNGKYSINAVLLNNITINDATFSEDGSYVSSSGGALLWGSIGNTRSSAYRGTFDGNGHIISGVYCKDYSYEGRGFFGFLKKGAVIKNLVIENSYFRGADFVGGICGYAMEGAKVINCGVRKNVIVSGINYVGGLVGYAGKDSNVTGGSAATVKGANFLGGAVGEHSDTAIISCKSCAIVDGKSEGSFSGHSHAFTKRLRTLPTCEYDGWHPFTFCVICNYRVSGADGSLSATGHREWSNANCLKPKTCKKCGKTEGEINTSNHASSETYTTYISLGNHNIYYSCCNELKATESHNASSPATCLERAYCYDCEHEFGAVNKNNHESDEIFYEYIDDSTHKEYNACCNTLKGTYSHNEDIPATCLELAHCNGCYTDFGTVNLNNHVSDETYLQVIDDNYHGVYYKCCNTLKEKVAHTSTGSSSANCTGVAKCDVCSTSYGSKDSTNHTGKIIYVNYDAYNGMHRLEWNCCNAYVGYEKHNYIYSVNKETNEIKGDCPDCGASYSVGISIPENLVYTGFGIYASTKGEIKGISPKITYSTKDGKAPINVGTYTATITLGNATISETFSITQKELTLTNVTGETRDYDGTNNVTIKDVDVDGIVILEGRNYSNNFTIIYDDVYVDYSKAKATVSDTTPGYYDVVEISGCTLAGKSAGNYTLTIADEVTLERFYIDHYYVHVEIENQNLLEGEALDNSKYILRNSLLEGYELTDVVLAMDTWSRHIYLESYAIKKDGVDYSDYFDIYAPNGIYAIKCLNHDTSDNGICSNCDTYEPAKISLNEWGEFIYEISNAGQLLWFGEQVNLYGASGHAKLINDIDLNPGYTFDFDGEYLLNGENTDIPPIGFTPIGNNDSTPYSYDFDGNGKTISGIYINTPENGFVGLFGKTDYMRTISNLNISNSYICGNDHVGAIAGYGSSYFDKCSVDETVTVVGKSSTGGMVGHSWSGEIINSYSNAKISADFPGGIAGYLNNTTVKNCYTTHYNLVADMYGEIVNSYYLNEPANYDGGRTAEQFANGEVAYLLQASIQGEEIYDEENGDYVTLKPAQVWGQKLGTDQLPVLGGDTVYYGYKDCNATKKTYCNNNAYDEIPTHNFESGNCTICGDKDPNVKLVSITGEITLVLEETHKDIFTGAVELEAGTYSFNVDDNGIIRGENSTYTNTATINYSADVNTPTKLKATGGKYTFTYNASTKSLRIEPIELSGDVNGDSNISVSDVIFVIKHIVGEISLDDKQFFCADMDSNGRITLVDVLNIQKMILEMV